MELRLIEKIMSIMFGYPTWRSITRLSMTS